ncbi:MAG: hemerythrin domain-containing protein [Holophagaceae bacterium]|nr:hemerythrin domain-containing protein [Holophagaceae bacterium]
MWSDAYRCGNPLIDAQHERLFQLANELLDALLSDRPVDEIAAFIQGLLREVVQHFHDEEAILAEKAFPASRTTPASTPNSWPRPSCWTVPSRREPSPSASSSSSWPTRWWPCTCSRPIANSSPCLPRTKRLPVQCHRSTPPGLDHQAQHHGCGQNVPDLFHIFIAVHRWFKPPLILWYRWLPLSQ